MLTFFCKESVSFFSPLLLIDITSDHPPKERINPPPILYLNDIDHSRTEARHPQTNGYTERFNQTLLDEFYQVAFRKKIYTSLDDIQTDLNEFLHRYNTKRTNQDKHCKGRTPMDTFTDGLELCRTYIHDRKEGDLEAA